MKNEPKILYIVITPNVGGAERSILTTIINLPPRIKEQSLILIPGEGPVSHLLKEFKISYRQYYYRKLTSPFLIFARFEIINPIKLIVNILNITRMVCSVLQNVYKYKPDVIHLNNFELNLYLPMFIKIFTRAKIICHIRELRIAKRKLFPLLLFVLSRFTDKIIVISYSVRDIFKGSGIYNKIEVLYNVVDPNMYLPKVTPQIVRNELGIRPEDFLVVSFGRITEWKGYDVLINAIAKLNNEKIFVCIAGDASIGSEKYYNELKNLVRKLNMENRIKFLGFIKDIGSLLNAADLVVHSPIEDEPLGRVVLEAMSLGKAVIASECGGIREIICSGENGVMFKPKDIDELAKNIKILYEDREKLALLGINAKQTIKGKFSPEVISSKSFKIYGINN
ncbi:MAG: glycosyltransferase family 4 protein [Candidatus Omnitrophica bacterium]|nr:glycosyltransferase family 4 protein [Candidatus Omnitrophota bacterium]